MQISPEQFENILPLAVQWAEAKEKVILEHGTALSPRCIEDAKSVGVKYPEKVRIYEVPQIPIPKHPILKAAAEETQLISPATIGIALRYGIFIMFFNTPSACGGVKGGGILRHYGIR